MAELVHYCEAWLATLSIAIWQLFFVVLHPGDYPLSMTCLDGRISADEPSQRPSLEADLDLPPGLFLHPGHGWAEVDRTATWLREQSAMVAEWLGRHAGLAPGLAMQDGGKPAAGALDHVGGDYWPGFQRQFLDGSTRAAFSAAPAGTRIALQQLQD